MRPIGRWGSLAAVALVLGIGGGRPAHAGDGDDDEPGASDAGGESDKRKQAGKHVEQGDKYKEAGEYDKAAREYEKAYDLVPHPELFFNLAQVYRLGGQKEKALEYYEKYLAVQPNGRAAPQSKKFARQLRKLIEKEKVGAGGGGSGSGSGAGSGTGSGSGADLSAGVDPGRKGRILRIAGMATAGAGLVSLAVGIKYGLDARRISKDLSGHDEGMWTEAEIKSQAVGERAEKRMFIGTGIGAAFIAGGAVLYYLGHRASADAEASAEEADGISAAPVVDVDSFGFALSGRF